MIKILLKSWGYKLGYKLCAARLFFLSGLVGKRGVQLRIQTRSHARVFLDSLALQQLFAVFFRSSFWWNEKLNI